MDTNNKTNEKLNKVWHFIAQYQQEHGFSPSYTEIAKVAGVTSKRGVSIQLKKLQEKRLIFRTNNARRAIKILEQPSHSDPSGDVFVKLPIVGEVVAGEPRFAEQKSGGYLSVSLAETHGTKDAFLLKVDGSSMNKLGYET
jgi:repressor LexA